MDNHFHLLFYQTERNSLTKLMHGILIAYATYYNRRHGRTGPLFESRFKSSLVDKENYLLHVSRYIHLNPRSWKYYKHSSIIHIRKGTEPEWLQTEKILDLHLSRKSYIKFVTDYEENRKLLADLKYQVADL